MNLTYDDIVAFARRNTYQQREVFENDYIADFQSALKCLGPALSKSRTGLGNASQIPDCVPHDELTMLIAGEAISQLDIANYRAWSDGEVGYSLRLEWEHILWRYTVTYPIGFLCARTWVKRSKSESSWSPAIVDLPSYAPRDQFLLEFSDRHIDGATISYGTYLRLFSGDESSKSPMINMALSDAFAYKPNPDNPLVISLRRALKKRVVGNQGMALPFWWAFAINALLAHDNTVTPVATHFIRDQRPAGPVSVRPVPVNAPTVDSTVTAQASSGDASAADAIVARCRELYSSGELKVNGAGADFHVTEGILHAVYPLLFDKLATSMAKDSIDRDLIVSLFQQSGLLHAPDRGAEGYDRYGFLPAGAEKPVGTTKLLRLFADSHRLLLSPSFRLEDNPDIVRLPNAGRAEGAAVVSG